MKSREYLSAQEAPLADMNKHIQKFTLSYKFGTLLSMFLLIGTLTSFAQGTVSFVQSSESRALGNNQAGAFGLQSLFGNPAGLSKVKNFGAMATAETRFAGSGILFGGAGAAIPSDLGVFGIKAGYFGLSAYNEQVLGLSYSRLLFESFSLSVQANLFNISIEEYGSQFNISATLGVQTYLNDAITVGMYVQNPLRIEVVEAQFLPTVFSLGAQYKFPEKLRLLFSVEKDLELATGVQAGLEYQPVEQLSLRVGISSIANELSFGLGFQISELIRIDASAVYHQILGLSPGFTFVYNKK